MGTRLAWQESIANTILQQKHANNSLAGTRRAWVAKAITAEGNKSRGVLASAVDSTSQDDLSKAVVASSSATGRGSGFGSFTEGSGVSHLHRLLRLRTERLLGPILGAPPPPPISNSPSGSPPSATIKSNPPSEVKVIINNQRGAPVGANAQPRR